MAVRATGFTKFLLATSITGKSKLVQTAATTERWANREEKDSISAIIEGSAAHGISPSGKTGARWRSGGLEWLNLSYFVYSLALALAMLLSLPYWLYQSLRHGKYRSGLTERLGKVPPRLIVPEIGRARILPAVAGASRPRSRPDRVIWVHAVSLGEVLAVSGLVEQMQRSFPQHQVLVSTTTDTGQALARQRFGEANVFYFPIDFAFAIRPYLRALQPELVVLAETEFCPNFLPLAHPSEAPIL